MKTCVRKMSNLPLVAAVLLAVATSASARDADDDPENGQSWLRSISTKPFHGGSLVKGMLRATDDFGVGRDREFRIEVSGSVERGDRRVVLHRYEPECLVLAPAARMTADNFCDRVTLTWSGRDLNLAFQSFDANKRYAFVLTEGASGQWQSPAAANAPRLALNLGAAGGGADYRWSLDGRRNVYTQAGAILPEELRDSGLSALEASTIALADVLRSFNSHEFAYSDLPREHPQYEPTPYLGWGENPVEGGCILFICFGDIGGGSTGGNGNPPDDMCDPLGNNFQPDNCPWDLTYATWPASHRIKIKKDSNDQVTYQFFIKNDGTGEFDSAEVPFVPAETPFVFISLIRVGTDVPLVSPGDNTPPYGTHCYKQDGLFNGITNPFGGSGLTMTIGPGASTPYMPTVMSCPRSSGRPSGRYRLYVHIDPNDIYDYQGLVTNNVGESGPLDWVNLRQ